MAERPDNLLQQKVYTILAGDSTLRDLLGSTVAKPRVYDLGARPDGEPDYPLVEIAEIELEDWGTYTSSGFQGFVTVNAWTDPQKDKGRKRLNELLGRIYTLLHDINLGLTGFPTIVCRAASNSPNVEDDLRTYRGTQRFRVILGGN